MSFVYKYAPLTWHWHAGKIIIECCCILCSIQSVKDTSLHLHCEEGPLCYGTAIPRSVPASFREYLVLGILGVDISSYVQFWRHLEGNAKLVSKMLGILNRAKQYFTPEQKLLLYKAQVQPRMEYCSHL